MSLAFILVHYHTPRLLRSAVEAIVSDLRISSLEADLVVVDNGDTAIADAELASLPVRWLKSDGNVGYAAALNSGIARTDADFLILMNSDVFVQPGCTAALIQVLADGAAVAGPKFYWDQEKQFLMPPTEVRTWPSELLAVLSERGDLPARWARNHWRRHAYRHWLATRPIKSIALCGALLATNRRALEQVGPFDEGFRRYFEEQDWLARIERQGLNSLYVPAAEAVHLFNQSAVQEPEAAGWFSESRDRFEKRYYGAWFPRLLKRCRAYGGRRLSGPPMIEGSPIQISLQANGGNREQSLWIEISPLDRGFPAGAAMIDAPTPQTWTFPQKIWTYLAPGRYHLTVCTASGHELWRACFERPAATKK